MTCNLVSFQEFKSVSDVNLINVCDIGNLRKTFRDVGGQPDTFIPAFEAEGSVIAPPVQNVLVTFLKMNLELSLIHISQLL